MSSPAEQPVAYDAQALPRDPAAALLLASKANGLGGEGLKPWYLKAHYQTYDAQGKPAAKGVFELYWAAKDHYRVSYTSDAFTQTSYRTPNGDYRVGSTADVPYAESLIWGELMNPIEVWDKAPKTELHEKKIGQLPLACLEIAVPRSPLVSSYCMDTQQAILRMMTSDGYVSAYNKIASFQHRFVSDAISLRDGAQPVLELAIDELRGARDSDLQAVTPPAGTAKTEPIHYADEDMNARGLDPSNLLHAKVANGHVLFKGTPTYPAEAKQRRAQGTVRLAVIIGKDGVVRNPVVVRDPDTALSKAAVETITRWRYQPYLFNGHPVDVRTIIRISFVLGG